MGENWATAFGIMKDGIVEGSIAAVKTRFVQTAPEDALALAGYERSMPQSPIESGYAYRARLLNAWNVWQYAGTRKGLVDAIALLGVNATVYENKDWAQPAGLWADFWVYLFQPHPFSVSFYVGDGTTCGSGVTIGVKPGNLYAALVNTIKQWRPAHAHLASLGIVFSGLIVGVGGWTVGSSNTVGGQRVDTSF